MIYEDKNNRKGTRVHMHPSMNKETEHTTLQWLVVGVGFEPTHDRVKVYCLYRLTTPQYIRRPT